MVDGAMGGAAASCERGRDAGGGGAAHGSRMGRLRREVCGGCDAREVCSDVREVCGKT